MAHGSTRKSDLVCDEARHNSKGSHSYPSCIHVEILISHAYDPDNSMQVLVYNVFGHKDLEMYLHSSFDSAKCQSFS